MPAPTLATGTSSAATLRQGPLRLRAGFWRVPMFAAFALLFSMALGLPAQAAAQSAPRFVDIFAVRTWLPPPPPDEAPAAAAPPEPQAPALPFRFIGRIVEPGKPPVFLLIEGEEVIAARVGEAIGKTYLLERYAGGQLVFRYRPLKTRQTLSVGE